MVRLERLLSGGDCGSLADDFAGGMCTRATSRSLVSDLDVALGDARERRGERGLHGVGDRTRVDLSKRNLAKTVSIDTSIGLCGLSGHGVRTFRGLRAFNTSKISSLPTTADLVRGGILVGQHEVGDNLHQFAGSFASGMSLQATGSYTSRSGYQSLRCDDVRHLLRTGIYNTTIIYYNTNVS